MAQKVKVETQVTRNGWGDRSKAGIGCRDKSGYGSMPSEMPDCRCGGAARGVTGWQPENDRTSAQAPSNRRGGRHSKARPSGREPCGSIEQCHTNACSHRIDSEWTDYLRKGGRRKRDVSWASCRKIPKKCSLRRSAPPTAVPY